MFQGSGLMFEDGHLMKFNGVNDNSTQGRRNTQSGCKFSHTDAATITMTPDGVDTYARVIVKNQGGKINSAMVKSAITCALTTSGAGGLDTGSEAVDTGYYVFLITDGNNRNSRLLCSLSETSPTLPAGYPFCSAPIWFISNNGDGDIREFIDVDGRCYYTETGDTALLTMGVAYSGWTVIDASVHAPNNSRVWLKTYAHNESSSDWNGVNIHFNNSDATDNAWCTIHHAATVLSLSGNPGTQLVFEHGLVANATGIYYKWRTDPEVNPGGSFPTNFSMWIKGWTLK